MVKNKLLFCQYIPARSYPINSLLTIPFGVKKSIVLKRFKIHGKNKFLLVLIFYYSLNKVTLLEME